VLGPGVLTTLRYVEPGARFLAWSAHLVSHCKPCQADQRFHHHFHPAGVTYSVVCLASSTQQQGGGRVYSSHRAAAQITRFTPAAQA
jgi:hypothetical protein